MGPGRILGVVAAGLALAAAVIAGALALGGTTQVAPPDEAQPIVIGVVAAPGQELTGPTDLPPLAMVLAEAVPPDIAALSPSGQVDRYRQEARSGDAPSLMRLGAAEQRAGAATAAADAYRRARAADPGAIAPAIGLAMADAATGDAGMARAAATLARITRDAPRSQLAWFNRGWLATYRRDGAGVMTSWREVVAIDPGSPLGRTAQSLLRGIADQAARRAGTRTGG